jgi:hypothetical protein
MMSGPKFPSQNPSSGEVSENWEVTKLKEESKYFKRQYEIILEKLKICDKLERMNI